ncbi:hypothetical protein M2271_005211 [Streptomyces sp. LBL]|nr:hypothetical protein [Streptomyces sp. LBL]
MSSLIQELRRREAAARDQAAGLRREIDALNERLAEAEAEAEDDDTGAACAPRCGSLSTSPTPSGDDRVGAGSRRQHTAVIVIPATVPSPRRVSAAGPS